MKKLFTNLLIVAITFVLSQSLMAQSAVGKLSGKVVDSQTKEPVIGANVVILNTSLGAQTDVEGNYFILNVSPGTYNVRVSFVGSATTSINDVRIVGGTTYELNIELTPGLEIKGEVIILARKLIEEKTTNTKKVLDAGQIGKLPVAGIEKLASLQSGVVIQEGSGGASGNANINVRGGRSGEVLYIVDGVPQNDVYTGQNYSQVSNSAIEQLTFEIGGYEAKYGQAQSGIVNVTTKSGNPTYTFYTDVLTSSFTDNYGFNQYTANISGPIIPGVEGHTFFLSGERGWYLDGDPRAEGISFNSDLKKTYDFLPNMSSGVWRFTGRTNHSFGDFSLRLGANINQREYRGFILTYAKYNSEHNRLNKSLNTSFSGRLSQRISDNSFWNVNLGYRNYFLETGDGVWFDQLELYGDIEANAQIGVTLPGYGQNMTLDNVDEKRVATNGAGLFYQRGRISNSYTRNSNTTMNADIDFTSQIESHLFEIGGGVNYNVLRYYAIGPLGLSGDSLRNKPDSVKYSRLQPTSFGYDVTGKTQTGKNDQLPPKFPIYAYAYLQDRFELNDIVLNIGLRADYFDTQADIVKNPELPFAYGDPSTYDAADFVTKKPEFYLSPRIGLGFPITNTTVFHAQYGKFIQQPSLNQLYTTVYDLNFLITDNNWSLNTGHVSSEVTTQYEVGFRQVLGEVAALNLTTFYKNTEGLINTATVHFQRVAGGATLRYITPTNTDFGTIKGLAVTLDVSRISYFSMSLNYTYALAEGTGSSTSSSFTAAFRNDSGEIPKVIAPLDFDQRHTGTLNVDLYIPNDELSVLENVNANVLVSFASGRPYTPLESQNLLAGTSNFGDTKGYVNSAYGPGNFRIDLKLEKSFPVGNLLLTPYVWIENLLDSKNVVNVYQSTGDPYTTGWLKSNEAKDIVASKKNPENYVEDYKTLERTPYNFGIPRLIKLGFKINFSNIGL